jgi:glycosyltransferase involved in cell wall biosynthesis
MRARGCNAIQSHGYKSHLYAAFLKNLIAVPWVAFAHGWTAENAKVRLYHSLDRLLLPRADAVVAVSQTLYTTIRAWRGSGSPTVLIENGVDAPPKAEAAVRAEIRNAIGVTPNDIVVGAFGRLSAEKGHRFLLEAFNAVAQDERNLSLLIIGSGPERRILEELKHRGPAPARITFLPHTSDIGRYFEAIDLLALPSLSEGLPNVLLEAMSHSLPVIATAVGAVPTVLKSGCNGLVVPPHDPGRLGEALRQLSRDGSLRTKLGAAGKSSLYPRFSPIERARAILFLYRALVSPRRFDYPQAAAAHL